MRTGALGLAILAAGHASAFPACRAVLNAAAAVRVACLDVAAALVEPAARSSAGDEVGGGDSHGYENFVHDLHGIQPVKHTCTLSYSLKLRTNCNS